MTTTRGLLLAVGCSMFVAVAPSAHAQRFGPEPKKKRSVFVSDTNNAMALYDWGLRQIDRDPSAAADAFYWAARVNPAYAEPLYARRAAMMLSDPNLLRGMMQQGRRGPSREVRQLDSLLMRALSLNPFLFRRFDRLMLVAFIRDASIRSADITSAVDGPQLTYLIEQYLNSTTDLELKAWMAYADANHQQALSLYAAAIKRAKARAPLRVERGRIFAMRGEADSAVAEFTAALADMRTNEAKALVVVYNSKAMIEHSIASLLEGRDDVEGAREAYGRALQEDLAFYPSHVRLGLLALGKGDTAAALSELHTAAEVAADEPWVRYSYGYALALAGQVDAAYEQLNKSVELEPLYAMPYPLIGKIWERRGDAAKAAAAYEAFLARASASDPQRERVRQALEEVRSFLPKGGDR